MIIRYLVQHFHVNVTMQSFMSVGNNMIALIMDS